MSRAHPGRRAAGRLVTALAIVALLVAVTLGALAGSALGERASEPGTSTLTVLDPALAPETGPAVRSVGGFTGFEGAPALAGRVVRTGTFEADSDTAVRITGTGGSLDLDLDAPARLLQLGPAQGPLAPGDLVVIRLDDDRAAAILRIVAQ